MSKKTSNANSVSKWDTGTGLECADDCSYADSKADLVTILIPIEVRRVIRHLCKTIEDEWQLLLLGSQVDEETVQVTGYYIPKQEVGAATVTNLDCIDTDFITRHQVIATMHSHSDMGVFFSKVDDDMTNMSQIQHHIVVNNKGYCKAASRLTLPCGLVAFADSEVEWEEEKESSVEIVGLDHISKKTYQHLSTNRATSNWNTEKGSKVTSPINAISEYVGPYGSLLHPDEHYEDNYLPYGPVLESEDYSKRHHATAGKSLTNLDEPSGLVTYD